MIRRINSLLVKILTKVNSIQKEVTNCMEDLTFEQESQLEQEAKDNENEKRHDVLKQCVQCGYMYSEDDGHKAMVFLCPECQNETEEEINNGHN